MTKPLNRIKGLNPMPEAVASQAGSIVPHSAHAEKRSHEYHKNVVNKPKATHTGGRQSSARITDQLNPDRSVSLANKTGRSFPGLAN
jgi:hypothetical protein